MIYAATGDVDNATNHLIAVLRLDPSDSWNWVVLGNFDAGGKNDPETAEKFIRKALELSPKPRKIYLSVLAMNRAYCLGVDNLFGGATSLAAPYRRLDNFAMARRVHDHWTSRADSLAPGAEYDLVDEFAEMLGIRGWYGWIPDMG